jgi:peptidyl-prolyl cis-trans isomerase D
MSAIQFLREKAGVFVAGTIGFSLFLFVVSDFFGRGRGQRVRQKKYYEIGQIAGEYVSYQDFEQRYQNLLEIRKLTGATDVDEATSEYFREQVWQQIVREKIQDKNYKKLGIGVSAEELNDLVLGDNPHEIVRNLFSDPTTKILNRSALVNFLKRTEVDSIAKNYWLFFEDEIVNERLNSKYNDVVSKGLYATSKQAEFDNNLNRATVDFSFILKNYASVSDSAVTISKNEIESYYSDHKDNFKRNALRDIEYVTFDIVPSEDDTKEAEQLINKIKEDFTASEDPGQFVNLTAESRYTGFFVPLTEIPENLRDFVKKEDKNSIFGPYQEEGFFKLARLIGVADRPDSVHVRHILLAPNQTRTPEQTKVLADSLIKAIKSGSSFVTLVKDFSDDQGSLQIGGDLGWFSEGKMIVPFSDVCFSGKKGEIVTAETTYGIHVIEILDQSKKSHKYNLGIIDKKILASSETSLRVEGQANEFAGMNDTYEKFNSAIAAQNMNKRVANDVTPQQKTLPELENPRTLIIALFSAKQGKIILDNEAQAVFEIDNKFVVAFCTRVQEEGIAPLKDVQNDIRYTVAKDKKADFISSEFIKNTRAGKTLDDIAREMNLIVQEATQINFRSYTVPGAGTEPALIAAASSAEKGVISGPVKGNNGVYMIYVNNVTTPSSLDLKMLQNRLTATFQMRGTYEAYEALRKDAKIVDNRYRFY